uniref:Uncharacterized protein n=1 Tax=uncultured Gemmatimonadales bacterium HF0770_11C06 TaxID=723616 RepID=E7C6Z8_9BACT|nr:hypothetical protein [uncultured Gemmatimonadales bacterium HF0770_11C06]
MKTTLTALATALFLCAVALPAIAQGQTENIAQAYVHTVQPERIAQFEEAVKRHVQWRKQNNDTWEWVWYQVVNGDGLGRYMVRSGNHRWADLDARYAWDDSVGAGRHFQATVGPYFESEDSSITQQDGALSRPLDDYSAITLFAVTEFDVRLPGQFREAITKIGEGLDRGDWGRPYLWQMGANGGTTDAALVVPAENWGELAPPAKPLPMVLAEVYGEQEASELLQQFARSIRSQNSYTLRVRRDLSLP